MNIICSVILVMLSICMVLNTFLLYRNQKINYIQNIRLSSQLRSLSQQLESIYKQSKRQQQPDD